MFSSRPGGIPSVFRWTGHATRANGHTVCEGVEKPHFAVLSVTIDTLLNFSDFPKSFAAVGLWVVLSPICGGRRSGCGMRDVE